VLRTRLILALVPLAGVMSPGGASAQSTSARFSGYLEHQFSLSKTPEGWGHIDYDRLRVDLEGRAGRGVMASAGLVWQIYRGRTETRLSDLLPASLRAGLGQDPAFTIDDRQYLNHAYIRLFTGPLSLTAGKQHLAWGRGLVFNPTELFRPKALYDPGYEREGVGALTATVETGALSDAALVYVPEDSWRTSAKVARVRSHVAGFDLSAVAAELWEDDAVAEILGEEAPLRRRLTFGGDLSGEMLGMGVWAEGTWSALAGGNWVELTVGGNTTLPGELLFSLEGYYDGRGEWDGPYALDDWMAVAIGTRRTLGRGMVFTSLSRPTGDLLTLGMAGLANAGDGSAALLPNAVYSFAENVDIFVQLVVTVGPDGSEFGTRGSGGLIRGRVYF
jgi:hypothetical protein